MRPHPAVATRPHGRVRVTYRPAPKAGDGTTLTNSSRWTSLQLVLISAARIIVEPKGPLELRMARVQLVHGPIFSNPRFSASGAEQSCITPPSWTYLGAKRA